MGKIRPKGRVIAKIQISAKGQNRLYGKVISLTHYIEENISFPISVYFISIFLKTLLLS